MYQEIIKTLKSNVAAEEFKTEYLKIVDLACSENRVKSKERYLESHHVIPDFMFIERKRKGPRGHLLGDPESSWNKVLLTFREHLMAHYYLYEICKGTRYEFSAGSALQFFFTKATGKHARQINLSEVDEKFLTEMDYLREFGVQSISNARKGTIPAVDAVTREPQGSVPVDHPMVLSGKWVHHSKGVSNPNMARDVSGSKNTNFKEITLAMKTRVFVCVIRSLEGNHLSKKKLEHNIKKEFTEFKKISLVWVLNNFNSLDNLLSEANKFLGTDIQYDPYYRSTSQRKLLSSASSRFRWYSDGETFKQIKGTEIETFLKDNPDFKPGKWKLKKEKV